MPSRGRRTNVALTAFLWAGNRKQVSTGRNNRVGSERRSMERVTASDQCLSTWGSLWILLFPLSTLWTPGGEWEPYLYPSLLLSSSFSLLSVRIEAPRFSLCRFGKWFLTPQGGVISTQLSWDHSVPTMGFLFAVETLSATPARPTQLLRACLRNHKSQSRCWTRKHQWLTEWLEANPYSWCCNSVLGCQLRAASHCTWHCANTKAEIWPSLYKSLNKARTGR